MIYSHLQFLIAMKKYVFLSLILLASVSVFGQKKIDARNGTGNRKVSSGKSQRADREEEVRKDEQASWERTRQVQDKKTRKKMDRHRKKARKVAIRRANRNREKRKFLGIF